MSLIKREKVEKLKKIMKEGVVLYPVLVLISIFWIISFKWSAGVKLTTIIFLILSIPVVNWLIENFCSVDNHPEPGQHNDEGVIPQNISSGDFSERVRRIAKPRGINDPSSWPGMVTEVGNIFPTQPVSIIREIEEEMDRAIREDLKEGFRP